MDEEKKLEIVMPEGVHEIRLENPSEFLIFFIFQEFQKLNNKIDSFQKTIEDQTNKKKGK